MKVFGIGDNEVIIESNGELNIYKKEEHIYVVIDKTVKINSNDCVYIDYKPICAFTTKKDALEYIRKRGKLTLGVEEITLVR